MVFLCSGLALIIFFPEGSHEGWNLHIWRGMMLVCVPLAIVQFNLYIFFFGGYIFLIYKFFFIYFCMIHFFFFNITFIFHRSASLIGSCPKVAHAWVFRECGILLPMPLGLLIVIISVLVACLLYSHYLPLRRRLLYCACSRVLQIFTWVVQ